MVSPQKILLEPKNFKHGKSSVLYIPCMKKFRKRLAQEIRRRRGEQTLKVFARKLGIPQSTLHNIENQVSSAKIDTLEQICKHLKCEIQELFPPLKK